MSAPSAALSADRPALGIALISLGVAAISVNDMLVKVLSSGYPLHQIVFIRSAIGLVLTLGIVQAEGGLHLLRTATPGLHALRGLLVAGANMTFFAAVAVLPLGLATALFFVAPLFITLLSIPLLGERVGVPRMIAILVGLAGVVVMQRPLADLPEGLGRATLLLPVVAALLYALMQVMTRKLGVAARASALAVYIHLTFLVVSALMFVVAGDGRFAAGSTDESVQFLLRAWIVPPREDWAALGLIGLMSGFVGYCLSASYRLADASVIAPFEYLGLPLAIFWGWAIFGEWPDIATWAGCALIVGAGLVVFLRERGARRPGRRAWPFRR
ncbi:Riboflavin transporter [Roseivivax jejudonensis]|uniref:Riboflavin transporter n=1 Tax=Roseivivax jejudonensis TaxID=1529041 RepID=A0A1X7A0M8_9RHOB|nr:DMT family transporter [Roseivivax jejudonensis]SLN67353.1 Riboflavin transporter [Roseivivax jejudonensis]